MKFKVALPILGFENEDEFELEQINDVFYRLKGKEVNFTLVNPFLLRDDYDFEISQSEQEALKLGKDKKFMVLNIMTLNEDFPKSTINFAAPLIFNLDDKLMGQVVLDKYPYSLMRPVGDFMKKEESEG